MLSEKLVLACYSYTVIRVIGEKVELWQAFTEVLTVKVYQLLHEK